MGGVFSLVLNALFPYRCPLCRSYTTPHHFCEACVSRMPSAPLERHFTLPLDEGLTATLPCHSAVPYTGEYRNLLHRFKFGNSLVAVKAIASRMAWCANSFAVSFDMVCFVHMQSTEKRKRGYNQSELLAKHTAKLLHLPVKNLIKKVRKTEQQHTLGLDRRTNNVASAFSVTNSVSLTGRTILLIDDIVTTGATLCACAAALYAAGAKQVCAVCFADTPKH